MFSLSARFRESRKVNTPGSVYYIIRSGKTERYITGSIKGADARVITEAKDSIVFDLMTIYCVIESMLGKGDTPTLDDIVSESALALAGNNPYADRIRECHGHYTVYDDIATVAKIFSDRFERKKKKMNSETSGLLGYCSHLADEYDDAGKPYAKSIRSVRRNLNAYLGGDDIMLSDVTPRFILDYRDYLSSRVSPDTVSFYIHVFHSVVGRAERDGLLSDGFRWPQTVKTSAARTSRDSVPCHLDIDSIRCIERLGLSSERSLDLARDMFMFGFYARGMELVDIAHLRPENLNGNVLTYRRRQKGRERRVILGDKALSIISKYRQGDSDYLFPVLKRQWVYSYTTVQTEFAASLKKIGAMLHLPVRLTFSMNIHSWQTIVRSAGFAEYLIS